mmetsp:Transcript_66660/g.152675  ORF Transcript_66660/g.152675 Transcript_66660/m.152675 type:complete len:247 (-) Transcript_66660:1459-2199(-)
MRRSPSWSARTAKGWTCSSASTFAIALRHFLAHTKQRVTTPRSARLATSASEASVLASLYPTQNTILKSGCGDSSESDSSSSSLSSAAPKNWRPHKVSWTRASLSFATRAAASESLHTNSKADLHSSLAVSSSSTPISLSAATALVHSTGTDVSSLSFGQPCVASSADCGPTRISLTWSGWLQDVLGIAASQAATPRAHSIGMGPSSPSSGEFCLASSWATADCSSACSSPTGSSCLPDLSELARS